MSVVVLGAGFGGLQLAARLSQAFGSRADVVLIDRSDGFVFGFSKLDVMFGRTTPEHVVHRYADLSLPGVRFVPAAIEAIDPVARRVTTTAGTFDAEILVVALGADLDPAATPGLLEAGHEFYTESGAFATRTALESFDGGRVVVAVTATPFKCPPAPSETVLMVHDLLRQRGLLARSQLSLVMPLPAPIPPSPAASAAVLEAFAERGIDWHPGTLVRRLDAERRVAVTGDGTELPFDLLLGVPRHRAPAVVVGAGMTEDGWVPVDPRTLETTFPGVYAIGDVTSVGTPKAGVFAEGQADVVADAIVARTEASGAAPPYGGRGVCWMEFGDDRVAKVDVTFVSGRAPFGTFDGPSPDLAADKAAFGADRARRWFGTAWTPVPRAGAAQDSAGGV